METKLAIFKHLEKEAFIDIVESTLPYIDHINAPTTWISVIQKKCPAPYNEISNAFFELRTALKECIGGKMNSSSFFEKELADRIKEKSKYLKPPNYMASLVDVHCKTKDDKCILTLSLHNKDVLPLNLNRNTLEELIESMSEMRKNLLCNPVSKATE